MALCQILDDSTELVYGPSTISIIQERDLKFNTADPTAIDTLLNDFENFSFVDRYRHYYQDLGNIGTAMFPVFYDLPTQIGRTPGYGAYDIYNVDYRKFNYYDTKSPHMDLQVVLGGQGRTTIDYLFTQNINPNWNFGFNVHKLNIDKQIGAEQNEGDRNVENTRFDFFTFYDHPEVPYRLLTYISSFSHKVDETGGISVSDSATNAEIFLYRDSRIQLEDVQASDQRLNFHLYHEYGLFKQFQLYHQLDRDRQDNTYQDFADPVSNFDIVNYRTFYPAYLIDPDSTYQESNFSSFSNEVGLKGTLASVYYRFYVKNRIVDQDFLYLNSFSRAVENYVGGITQFKWKDLFTIRGDLELLQTGEFKFGGTLESDLLNVSYRTIRYRQPNLVQDYFGNHFEWHNSFEPGFSNEINGNLKIKWRDFEFIPGVQFKTLDNYVYYDTLSTPKQTSSPVLISRFGGSFKYYIPTNRESGAGFHINNEGYFTSVEGVSEAVSIPKLFYNGKVFWSGSAFKRTVPMQVGFNLHAKSSYFANAYSPSIQQFYIQNSDKLKAYFTIDAFWSMRVDKIFVFVKLTHANMPTENGYFVTPDYTGQQRSFDFGVRWLFFD